MLDKPHTVKDTLGILCISRTRLYQLISEGKIKPVKMGKRTLFFESELNRFLEGLKEK